MALAKALPISSMALVQEKGTLYFYLIKYNVPF
jgi:hypothetical protein